MIDAIGPLVRMEHEGRVARVVIGSGMRRNALRSSGWVAIERTVHRLAADDVLRPVIIEGAGLAAHGGAAVAGDLLYTGRMVGAREAATLGMANVCVPGDELDRHVEIVIDAILRASDASIRAVKIALRSLASPARVAARAAASKPAVSDEDFSHRVNAFVQGRRPRAVRLAT